MEAIKSNLAVASKSVYDVERARNKLVDAREKDRVALPALTKITKENIQAVQAEVHAARLNKDLFPDDEVALQNVMDTFMFRQCLMDLVMGATRSDAEFSKYVASEQKLGGAGVKMTVATQTALDGISALTSDSENISSTIIALLQTVHECVGRRRWCSWRRSGRES